jgi:hypothetical protein
VNFFAVVGPQALTWCGDAGWLQNSSGDVGFEQTWSPNGEKSGGMRGLTNHLSIADLTGQDDLASALCVESAAMSRYMGTYVVNEIQKYYH